MMKFEIKESLRRAIDIRGINFNYFFVCARMRSIIDHFKGSRDFPRLRIGMCLRALLTPPHCFYILSAVKWMKIF